MPDIIPAPVHDADVFGGNPREGIALCLSGGGYRAMVFHIGSILRLNDLGILGKLDRISSVSGGSITAGVLGMNWGQLGLSKTTPKADPVKLKQFLVEPLRKMASTTIDEGAIFGGIFLPGTISDHVADKYASLLFGKSTLQDLPDDTAGPRFVINATNVQSGVLMRFSKPYMRDYRVGQVLHPQLPLARAVAASSAFPPILSPCEIDVKKYGLKFEPPAEDEDLNTSPYNEHLVLSDGGVYDNLGLETAWKEYKTLLVSDAGGHFKPEPDPKHDWARHAYRVLDLVDSQVRALRTRDLIILFQQHVRSGTYWSIRQDLARIGQSSIPAPSAHTTELADIATRLQKLDDKLQERLINWGYVACSAALRKNYSAIADVAEILPYPGSGI